MTTYYIDKNHGSASDSNVGTDINLPWLTIGKANTTLAAGDTVNIRAGTYSSEQIHPSNSGTSGNYITYQNYLTEIVTLLGGSRQADLVARDWVMLDGLCFDTSNTSWIYLSGSHNNTIQNCTFRDAKTYAGFNVEYSSTHNRILNNTFLDSPDAQNAQGTNPADHLRFRYDSNYNLVEGNVFHKTGHQGAVSESSYNVIRNNEFKNKWHTGMSTGKGNNLVELNVYYDSGDDYLNDPIPAGARRHNPGIQCVNSMNIIRNNVFDNCGAGITFVTNSGAGNYSDSNFVYNNTINHSNRNIYMSPSSEENSAHHNKFKNNIFANAVDGSGTGYNVYMFQMVGVRDTTNKWHNNNVWGGTGKNYYQTAVYTSVSTMASAHSSEWNSDNIELDPLFTDELGRDFSLQSNSPCKNAGTWLTTISSATNAGQATIIVDDANYFYDGWGISGETGDVIKTEGGEEATITSINYSTNTLTVSPAINIVNGEGLALTYDGTAPDIGACEYQGDGGSQYLPYIRMRGIKKSKPLFSVVGRFR